MRPPLFRLCMLISRKSCTSDPINLITAAASGGVDCVQLREKALDSRDFFAWGEEIRQHCADLGIKLVVNDNVEVAIALSADGVHLGQDDMHPEDARRLVGEEMWIGWSTRSLEQLDEAAELGVNYAGFGPVFATATKDYPQGMGAEHLAAGLAVARVPLVAIGGITPDNCWMIPEQCAIAASSSLCGSNDPARSARSLNGRSLEPH